MNEKNNLKRFKNMTIIKMVLSLIYTVLGVFLLIVQINENNEFLSNPIMITSVLTITGLVFFIINLIPLINPAILRRKTIKFFDELNLDLSRRASAFSFFIVMSVILLFAILLISSHTEISAILVMIFIIGLIANLITKFLLKINK